MQAIRLSWVRNWDHAVPPFSPQHKRGHHSLAARMLLVGPIHLWQISQTEILDPWCRLGRDLQPLSAIYLPTIGPSISQSGLALHPALFNSVLFIRAPQHRPTAIHHNGCECEPPSWQIHWNLQYQAPCKSTLPPISFSVVLPRICAF